MFESAELGHKVDKETFKKEVPKLRAALLDAQYDMLEKKEFPVVILISGVDGSGKGETINLLYSWMDPRHISTLAFSAPTDEEAERPYMWRYWRALPPKGKVGIFAGSWYSQPITDRITGAMRRSELDERLDDINRFEAMLVNEGALVLKFWFHLSKDGQKTRLKALEKNPNTAWRVTKQSYERLKTYDKLQEVAGHVLRVTNTAKAPWIIVEGTDDEYRSLTVGRIVLDAMQRRLKQEGPAAGAGGAADHPSDRPEERAQRAGPDAEAGQEGLRKPAGQVPGPPLRAGARPAFRQALAGAGLRRLGRRRQGRRIRRITAALDARFYQIVPVAAPTEEERAQPYLWRFWRHLPRTGRVGHLRPLLVRPRAGRAGRGLLRRGRLAARLCRDQRFRAAAGRGRRRGRQVLAADQCRRAAAPLQGAPGHRLQALQDHRGRLAQPREMGCLRATWWTGLRHGRPQGAAPR
jgi:AMP-polyphosphate phosphotransferase